MSKVLTTKSNRIDLDENANVYVEAGFLIVESDHHLHSFRKRVIWPMTEILNYREEDE